MLPVVGRRFAFLRAMLSTDAKSGEAEITRRELTMDTICSHENGSLRRTVLNGSVRNVVLLMLALSTVCASQEFNKAELFKTNRQDESRIERLMGLLRFDKERRDVEFIDEKNTHTLMIRQEGITSMLYEPVTAPLVEIRDHPERIPVAFLALIHVTHHFLTINYAEPGGHQRNARFRLDKGNYRQVLAAALTQTGKKVEGYDEIASGVKPLDLR
jgi:hypothetical protein